MDTSTRIGGDSLSIGKIGAIGTRWIGVAFAAMLAATGLMLPLDWKLEAWISSLAPIAPTEDVTVVGIDRKSLRELGDRAFEPIERAQVIQNLLSAGARRIFVDFGMAQLGNRETAAAVTDILGNDVSDRVAFPVFSVSRNSTEGISEIRSEPDHDLQAISTLASVAVPIDTDGVARRIFSSQPFDGRDIVSAPAWLTGHPVVPNSEIRINFALELDQISSLSLVDVLKDQFDERLVAGRLIVVGATDLVLGDQLSVPRYSIIAGSEFLALAAASLQNDVVLSEIDPIASLAITATLTLLCSLSLTRLTLGNIALIVAFLISMALSIAATSQIQFYLLLQPTAPIVGIVVGALVAAFQSTGFLVARQKRADSIIDEQATLIGRFLESSRDGIMTLGPGNRVVTANAAMHRLWGKDPSGRTLAEILPDLTSRSSDISSVGGELTETVLQLEGAEELPVEVAFNQTQQGDHLVTIAMVRDLRERKAHERQLTELATHDSLTGLSNRYQFEKTLGQMVQKAEAELQRLAIILVDLDQFKEVNDTLGHTIGDTLLIAVAERFDRFKEQATCVARLGGDEFAVALDLSQHDVSADRLANELFNSIVSSYSIQDLRLEIGASIGIAQFPDDAGNAEKLLQCADVAMYQAKQDGGGVKNYDAAADENSVRRLTLKGQLRSAIDSDEFALYYQPKVCPHRGEIVGSEALIRWFHPELGFMPPDEFIPAAEQSGVILPLTVWCIRQALKDKASFGTEVQDLPISVNVSARILSADGLVEAILDEVKACGKSPGDLTLEVTESAIMTQVDQSLAAMAELSNLGFKLSLDDFGAGYSSFDYLRRLPVDELKIDRAFVVASNEDRRAREILKGMIDLGHGLGLSVVCEGIETIYDFNWLSENGCDIVQGYFTGKPMPAAEFGALSARVDLPIEPRLVRRRRYEAIDG